MGWIALEPQPALQVLLARREEELREAELAARDLSRRFENTRASRPVANLVEVISGHQEVSEQTAALFLSAQTQVRHMVRPPYYQSLAENRAYTTRVHQRNIQVRNLIDQQTFGAFGLDVIREDIAFGEDYRIMVEVPFKLSVVDERAAILPLETHQRGIESALLVRKSALLESFVALFDILWQLASPLEIVDESVPFEGAAGSPRSSEQRQLLAFLVAGLPDGVIAHHLKISMTTLDRRVRAIKQGLGAATRFQAGWLARDRLGPQ